MSMKKERLQKVIAQSGYTSRRKAEALIEQGNVKVNGEVITKLGTRVITSDVIEVNNKKLEKENNVYYVLHKPLGYISAVSDDRNRKTVIDLLPRVKERIFPIGRLDYDTSGILLLTNDGTFAHKLMHPKFAIEKVYHVAVKGKVNRTIKRQILDGVIDNNERLRAVKYRVIRFDRRTNTSLLELTLLEGRNRHIRRMLEKVGFPVQTIKRIQYGIIKLNNLEQGKYRSLTTREIELLKQLALENVE